MWYYASEEERKGPVTEQAMQSLYAMKQVSADTLVWQDGMTDWKPLSETELAEVLETPLPEGDAWQTCAYSGENFRRSKMVQIDGFWIAGANKDDVVDFIKQGGVLPKGGAGLANQGDNLRLGYLLSRAWSLMWASNEWLLAIYLMVAVPQNLFSQWFDHRFIGEESIFKGILFSVMCSAFFGAFGAGASITVLLRRQEGLGVHARELMRAAAQNWLSLAVISVVVQLMVMIGTVFLLVPGLYAFGRLLCVDVLAVDRKLPSTAALLAGFNLTGEHAVKSFGLGLVLTCVWFLFGAPFMIPTILVPGFDHWLVLTVASVIANLPIMFIYAMAVCYTRELEAYHRLRSA